MKILRFTCKRDEILGNLNLKFNIASDYPLSIVILAGENGLGKTTLLNHIYKLCSLQPYDLFSRQFYSLTVYFSPREVCSLMMVAPELKLAHSSYKDTLLVTFGWDYKLKPSQGFFCKVKLMDGTSIAVDSAKFLKSSEIKRYLGLIFLDDSMSLRETKNSNLSVCCFFSNGTKLADLVCNS